MGGVLVDLQRERAIRNFMTIGVSDADNLISTYRHHGIFFDFENGNIDTDEFCRLLCEHVGKPIPREAIEDAWRSIINPPLAFKLAYLSNLRKKGLKIFLLTNNNPIIFRWACSPGFTPFGDVFTDYFDKIYLSYQMKCSKPDLKIFRMMIEDAGIDSAESLYIEDSERNNQAASACGFQTILVKNASDWREELTKSLEVCP